MSHISDGFAFFVLCVLVLIFIAALRPIIKFAILGSVLVILLMIIAKLGEGMP